MNAKPTLDELFEPRLEYPDPALQDRLSGLVGLEEQKNRLAKILGVLVNHAGLETWAKKHHPDAGSVLKTLARRPPLVVLAGDVGAGESELAQTIGDAVARQERISIVLLPLSLSSRGQGRVGEMTQLISAAFDHAVEEASKVKGTGGKSRGAVILLVDEADALAQSRESSQMHHEDKAGVNAFIRGIDRLGNAALPAAVIMCTNRLGALDPAIKRRAADILSFERPNEEQRRALLAEPLRQLGLNRNEVESIVAATGKHSKRAYGFTYSDLRQRLLPSIVLDAYPDSAVSARRALEIAHGTIPTAPFNEGLS